MNKKEAFAKFSVTQVNERWSWSGISEDGLTLVLTLWSDQYRFNKESRIYEWSTFGRDIDSWIDDAGNAHRIRDISYAIEKLEGRFRAIRVDPDTSSLPNRTIKKVSPILNLEWEITDFDPNTGECAGRSFPELRPFGS